MSSTYFTTTTTQQQQEDDEDGKKQSTTTTRTRTKKRSTSSRRRKQQQHTRSHSRENIERDITLEHLLLQQQQQQQEEPPQSSSSLSFLQRNDSNSNILAMNDNDNDAIKIEKEEEEQKKNLQLQLQLQLHQDSSRSNSNNNVELSLLTTLWNETSDRMYNDIASGRKYFILHIGPYKTGTTFIQQRTKTYEFITLKKKKKNNNNNDNNTNNNDVHDDDNYVYIGKAASNFPGPLHNDIKNWTCRNVIMKRAYRIAVEASRGGGGVDHHHKDDHDDDDDDFYYNNTIGITAASKISCWKRLVHNLQITSNNGTTNIFLSSESVLMEMLSIPSFWWYMLHETCQQMGLQLIVVIAYRRLSDWFLSANTQWNTGSIHSKNYQYWPDLTKTIIENQYLHINERKQQRNNKLKRYQQQQQQQVAIDDDDDNNNDTKSVVVISNNDTTTSTSTSTTTTTTTTLDRRYGKDIIPLFPAILDSMYLNLTHGIHMWFPWTPEYINSIPNGINKRIWNVHEYPNRTTMYKWYCIIMPNTPFTCNAAIQRELDQIPEFTSNPSSSSDTICYDYLAIQAAKLGYIYDPIYHHPNRRIVWKHIQHYNEHTLNQTCNDLPISCPTRTQLEILFNSTILWEQKLQSTFYNKPPPPPPPIRRRIKITTTTTTTTNDDDDDTNNKNNQIQKSEQQQHVLEEEEEDKENYIEKFWYDANIKKKYCFIDAVQTLQLTEWKIFFQKHYSQNKINT